MGFLADERQGAKPSTLVGSEHGTTKAGGIAICELFGNGRIVRYPKPPALIQRLVRVAATQTAGEDEELIVMDFYAGSGTTGQAVMQQCVADGVSRRFILVQLPEPLDPTDKQQALAATFCDDLGLPRSIAELTKERLRRASAKIAEGNPTYDGDLGFRVLKLESVEHLRPDRSESDVLHELLLELGLDLCVPIETRVVADREVQSIGGGVLIACLDERIDRVAVEPLALGIVAWQRELDPAGPTTCVFRDGAFADDVAKTNLAAILEQHEIGTVRSI